MAIGRSLWGEYGIRNVNYAAPHGRDAHIESTRHTVITHLQDAPDMSGAGRTAMLWGRVRPTQAALPWHLILAASVAGALTIAVLGLAGDITGAPMLITAFGSSCVLVFLMPDSALAQPVNVIAGHVIAAVAGLIVQSLLPATWWSMGIAVGLAMAAMAAARVIHPPAGGTPIAVMMTHAGWGYLFTPVLAGAVVLMSCAMLYRVLVKRFGA